MEVALLLIVVAFVTVDYSLYSISSQLRETHQMLAEALKAPYGTFADRVLGQLADIEKAVGRIDWSN